MTGKFYTRLSRDEVGQTSTADQERECRALARRLNIDQIEIFPEDPGTSAYKDVPRPVFDRLIRARFDPVM
jgi:resolvase-like protein